MTDEGHRRVAVVVEDDSDIRNLLDAVLTQAGFETHSAVDGLAGVEAVRQHNPSVTTLDVSLPGIDGFEVARRIRAFSSTYIVMLTARNEEIDALIGLDAGADDYVTKPFRPRELRARIEAMLRRPRDLSAHANDAAGRDAAGRDATSSTAPATSTDPATAAGSAAAASSATAATASVTGSDVEADDWSEHNGLRLSEDMRLVERDGERISLTKTEFALLAHIMSNGRRVVSKSSLAIAARPDDFATGVYITESEHRAVEVHLANLRRKLGDNSSDPRWIETVRGVGYRLAERAP